MKKGDLIIIPTDTVYGLAGMLHDQEALAKIYTIKGREQSQQIPILISKMSDLTGIAETTILSRKVMKSFWPGPLTIVMRTTEEFYHLTGERTIAARMPNHDVAQGLLKEYGVLRAASLHKNGEQPIDNFKQIKETFSPFVSKIYEQKYNQIDLSSTVLDMTGDSYIILREGNIKKEDLDLVLKDFIEFFNGK